MTFSEPSFSTPHTRRQLQTAMDQIESTETLSRPLRRLFRKMGDKLDQTAYKEADLGAQIVGQKRKIDDVEARRRRKIPISAQMAFADIDTIKAAKDKEEEEDRAGTAYSERLGQTRARQTANEMANRAIEACTVVFSVRE
jgi:ribosomal 50S subunit-associated protein YjgA (DUF615 family)